MGQQQQQQSSPIFRRTRTMRVGWRVYWMIICIVIVLSYWNLFSFEVHLKMVRDVTMGSHNHYYDIQRQRGNNITMILHTNNSIADDVPLSDSEHQQQQQQQHKIVSKSSKAKIYSNGSKNKTIVFNDNNDTMIVISTNSTALDVSLAGNFQPQQQQNQHKRIERHSSRTKFSDDIGNSIIKNNIISNVDRNGNVIPTKNNTTDTPALDNLHDHHHQEQQQEEEHKKVSHSNKTKISFYGGSKNKTTGLVADKKISIYNSTTVIPVWIDKLQQHQKEKKEKKTKKQQHEIVFN